MKFSISGADTDTGENIEMTIEAADESAAQDVAQRKGIVVSRVSQMAVAGASTAVHPVVMQQPLEQGHFRGAPIINIAPPRRGNSLGIAAIVLGILAFLICWIPIVNLLGVPLSALGLVLGLIGVLVALTRKGASIGYPIAGSAVCGLALFIAIGMTGAFVGGLKKASDELVKDADRRGATNQSAVAPAGPKSSASKPPKSAEAPPKMTDTTPAAQSVITPQPVPAKPEVEWVSANTPVRQGDIQVQVNSVRVGKVPLKGRFGDSNGESKDALLMIEFAVSNLSETKKVEYRSWGGSASSFGSRTTLSDNFDNRYKLVNFGVGSEVVGSIASESIYPAKTVRDVIVFEEPIGRVEHLNLELPASQFGGSGMLRIRVPASMIQR